MSEDVSDTSGTVPTSGRYCHSVPKMVLFDVMCTKAAFGSSFNSFCFGTRVKFSLSVDAATFTAPTRFASFAAFCDHAPVMM